jgi:nanoRNase/pAp phosphatase (c-di-AMP/oligoRNAs hydrolase)
MDKVRKILPYQTPFTEERHVIIFHASCADGFCAATLLWDALINGSLVDDVLLIPANYGQPLPSELQPDDIVYLLDFSYKRETMQELCDKVKYLYVLDHHKTALEELKLINSENATIFFDMKRSGAMMTFDFIQCMKSGLINTINKVANLPHSHPDFQSTLVKYVQDRDLWTFKLPFSKEISAYLQSVRFDLKAWSSLFVSLNDEIVFKNCVRAGAAILKYKELQVQLTAEKAVEIKFPLAPGSSDYETVRILNTTVNHSEVGEALCVNFNIPFSVTWFYRADGKFQYSLRSRGGYDVSKIAEAYGGGGHPAAAGFESDVMIEGVSYGD